ncbi:MAG: hypothetical protein HN929_07665 [Chloroflexi bacterium]|jgi:hypothetical protein|nr:hypothetical protein [Chloroflexota bacterium]MBT7081326.1 hypothetical protein [Chloroflexota bacterium]MBT7290494.1 hypothetical protein [Chloroflexota bacterium]
MPKQKSCFIIMPITTPGNMVETYRDSDHFKHVLNHLFIPSIEAAGYKSIPPITKGADIIHAEIIKNLETSDMVLCDLSCLNPNVFFELGIRTSLNKPVCLVKDELTPQVPFDTGIINNQKYNSGIQVWDIETEIANLTTHILDSVERSKEENTLWKVFSMKQQATVHSGEFSTDDRLDFLTVQMDSILNQMSEIKNSAPKSILPSMRMALSNFPTVSVDDKEKSDIVEYIQNRIPPNVALRSINYDDKYKNFIIRYVGNWSARNKSSLSNKILNLYDHGLSFKQEK